MNIKTVFVYKKTHSVCLAALKDKMRAKGKNKEHPAQSDRCVPSSAPILVYFRSFPEPS